MGNIAHLTIKYLTIYETIKQKKDARSGHLRNAPRDRTLCLCKLLGPHFMWTYHYDRLSI